MASRQYVIERPAPRTHKSLTSVGASTVVFGFSFAAARLSREGDDLALTFEDGASVRLEDFYAKYDAGNLPDFQVDGRTVHGRDFFESLHNPDLDPADASSRPASGGGHTDVTVFSDTEVASVHLVGLARLDGVNDDVVVRDGLSGEGQGFAFTGFRPRAQESAPRRTARGIGEVAPVVADEGDAVTWDGTGSFDFDPGCGDFVLTVGGLSVKVTGGVAGGCEGKGVAAHGVTVGTLWLSANKDGSWTVGYAYNFEGSATHGAPGSSTDEVLTGTIPIRLTVEGRTYEAFLQVSVKDDVPSLANGAIAALSGSSVEGALDVDFGADKGGGASVLVNGMEAVSRDGTKLTYELETGTLVLDTATGAYTFTARTLDDGTEGVSQEIVVRVTDADGDTVTGKVAVTVARPVGNVTVTEEGLTDGGDTGGADAGEAVTWTAPDGYVVAAVFGNQNGRVSFTPGDNHFSYVLNGALTNGGPCSATDAEMIADRLEVLLEDGSGRQFTVYVDVTAVDDTPVFGDFVPAEESETVTDTGDLVFSTEGVFHLSFGADGRADVDALAVTVGDVTYAAAATPVDSWVFNLPEGTLTVTDRGDGTFGYAFAVARDHADTGFRFDFTVTAKDADGDTVTSESSATVIHEYRPTLDLSGTPVMEIDEAVEETWDGMHSFVLDLHGRDGSVTVGGMTVAIRDGRAGDPEGQAASVNGVTIEDMDLIRNEDGTWTVEYLYSFDGSAMHGKPGSDTDEVLTGTIPVEVTDAGGRRTQGALQVSVKDDSPSCGNSTISVESGFCVRGTLDVDLGADNGGGARVEINGFEGSPAGGENTYSYDLQHGTLVLNVVTGAYTYTAYPLDENDSEVSEELVVVVVDADGDRVEGTSVINVTKPAGPGSGTFGNTLSVYESGLTSESDASETAGWTAPEGYTIVSVDGWNNGEVNVADDKASFTYTLNGPLTHDRPDNDTEMNADKLEVTLQDERGNQYTVTVDVTAVDDEPTSGVRGLLVESGATVHGTLVDFGADKGGNASIVVNDQEASKVEGTKCTYELSAGTLVLDTATGEYTFTAAKVEGQVNQFGSIDFTVTDADGDTVEAGISFFVFGPNPVGGFSWELCVNESDLTGDDKGTVTWQAPDGYTIVSVDGVGNGTVNFTAGGNSFSYTLNGPLTHTEQGADSLGADTAHVILDDGNGRRYAMDVNVTVVDDVPVFGDIDSAPLEEITTDKGIYIASTEGTFELSFGADGQAGPVDALAVNVDGSTYRAATITEDTWVFELPEGELTVTDNKNGTFGYVFSVADKDAGSSFEFDFSLTAEDGDGDTVTSEGATVVYHLATIHPSSGISIDEADDGTWTGKGSFEVDFNGESGSVSVGGVTAYLTETGPMQSTEAGDSVNGVTINSVTLSPIAGGKWTVEYTYSFDGSVQHGEPGSETDKCLNEIIPIHVIDSNSHTSYGAVKVSVNDDEPNFSDGDLNTYFINYDYYESIELFLDNIYIGSDYENSKIIVSLFNIENGNKIDTTLNYIGVDYTGHPRFENGYQSLIYHEFDSNWILYINRPVEDVDDNKYDKYILKLKIVDGDGDEKEYTYRTEISTFTENSINDREYLINEFDDHSLTHALSADDTASSAARSAAGEGLDNTSPDADTDTDADTETAVNGELEAFLERMDDPLSDVDNLSGGEDLIFALMDTAPDGDGVEGQDGDVLLTGSGTDTFIDGTGFDSLVGEGESSLDDLFAAADAETRLDNPPAGTDGEAAAPNADGRGTAAPTGDAPMAEATEAEIAAAPARDDLSPGLIDMAGLSAEFGMAVNGDGSSLPLTDDGAEIGNAAPFDTVAFVFQGATDSGYPVIESPFDTAQIQQTAEEESAQYIVNYAS